MAAVKSSNAQNTAARVDNSAEGTPRDHASMTRSTATTSSGNVFADLGIAEPDFELAKADLAVRIQRLAEHRRLTSDEAAALLQVPESELAPLFQGRLATCSLDQLLRMLTWLGDDLEIVIRPRLQRTKRGALRVLQAAAVEKADAFGPVHDGRSKAPSTTTAAPARTQAAVENIKTAIDAVQSAIQDDRQLLDKYAVEKMTCLDITTVYRRMKVGTFPQPVRIGRRRVAWRTSDFTRWQQDLEVGTETFRRQAQAHSEPPGIGTSRRRGRK